MLRGKKHQGQQACWWWPDLRGFLWEKAGMEDGYRSLKSRAEKKVGRKPNKIQRETVSKAAQETAQK